MSYKILVLEDIIENQDAAKKGLSPFGEVIIASNYKEGVELLEKYNPDLAFVDVNFPYDEDSKIQELGHSFIDNYLNSKIVPYAIVTSYDHRGNEDTLIDMNIPRIKTSLGFSLEENITRSVGSGHSKKSPNTWENAYINLMSIDLETEIATKIYIDALKIHRELLV
ncbi:hypothetical protein C0585_02155 [Candidatus Woesearchaeota archaeon]|nr:MAG: hypothetical protein C0585_02155 [Candidatus Woesearchaeota archaeon]